MKKARRNESAEPAIPENWNNPFADLELDLPEPPPPPPPPPPSREELQREALDDEDKKLLAAFEGAISVGHDATDAQPSPGARGKVSFNIQRKGKGGKTVTIVRGLQSLELADQMALCSQVKNALGCGARFLEGVLEIQGDQRDRAMQWFADHGFRTA